MLRALVTKILDEGVKVFLAAFALWGAAMSLYFSGPDDPERRRGAFWLGIFGLSIIVLYAILALCSIGKPLMVDTFFVLILVSLYVYYAILIRRINKQADKTVKTGVVKCELLLNAEAINTQGMEHLRNANTSFDILAVAMTRMLSSYTEVIQQKAMSGVRIRLLLLDPSAEQLNRILEDSFGHISGSIPILTRDALASLATIVQKQLPDTHKTNIQVKLLSTQILYSMWTIDSQYAHLQPFFYRGTSFSPAIRCNDKRFISSTEAEFKHLWGEDGTDNATAKKVDLRTYPIT